MATPFVNLIATHNPHRWYLPLDESLCVGPPGRSFMFGGVGMAAAIQAMERTCGRPVVWATAQYLSFGRPPSVVDLDVTVPASGRNTTQARVIGHVGDTEIFTVNAALGSRPSDISHQWVEAPDVPRPTIVRRRITGAATTAGCTAASSCAMFTAATAASWARGRSAPTAG